MYKNDYPYDEGWPSDRQKLLLKLAISDPAIAYKIWQGNKKSLIPVEKNVSSRFILPLVYENIMGFQSKIDPSILNYYRKLYLRTHVENTKRLNTLTALATAFHDAGLQLTLLKGSAMLLLYYKKPGLRPMSDIDIYIPSDKIEIALSLLGSLGWQPKPGSPEPLTRSYMKWLHGYEFYNSDGQYIDLHWHIMNECCYAEVDDALRQTMVEFEYNGIKFLALNPADQLLQTLDQNARCEGFVYLRWVADAARVIQHQGIDIDWQRLIRLAKDFCLILPVKNGLAYMKEQIGIDVPGDVLSELNNLPVTKTEHFEYHYKRKRIDNRLFSYWPVLWFDYSRRLRDKQFLRKVAGFPLFLKEYWGIANVTVLLNLFREMIGKMLSARKL